MKQRFEPKNSALKVLVKLEFQQMKQARAEHDPYPWITNVESFRSEEE
jgi:hypothetical protein